MRSSQQIRPRIARAVAVGCSFLSLRVVVRDVLVPPDAF